MADRGRLGGRPAEPTLIDLVAMDRGTGIVSLTEVGT